MKKYSLIFTSLLIITGMGCKKDFLEQSNPNAVTVENAYNTETDIVRCYQIIEGIEFVREFFKPTLKMIKEITLVDLIEQE